MEIVKLWTFLYPILIIQNVSAEKESHNLSTDKKIQRKVKHLTGSYKNNPDEQKSLRSTSESPRCTILCPVVVVFPTNCNGTSNYSTTSNITTASTEVTTNKPSTTKPSEKSLHLNDKKFIKKSKDFYELRKENNLINIKVKNKENRSGYTKGLTSKSSAEKSKRNGKNINENLGENKLGTRKYNYHDLNLTQKRLLLRQLNLGNNNGKKAFEFRETSTSLCRVVCLEEDIQSNTPIPEKNSTERNDESDEGGYEEGEDTPIEATIKPAVPQSVVISGIRPFGAVNFNGMDDFGPNGELARDIRRSEKKHN